MIPKKSRTLMCGIGLLLSVCLKNAILEGQDGMKITVKSVVTDISRI